MIVGEERVVLEEVGQRIDAELTTRQACPCRPGTRRPCGLRCEHEFRCRNAAHALTSLERSGRRRRRIGWIAFVAAKEPPQGIEKSHHAVPDSGLVRWAVSERRFSILRTGRCDSHGDSHHRKRFGRGLIVFFQSLTAPLDDAFRNPHLHHRLVYLRNHSVAKNVRRSIAKITIAPTAN